MAIYSKRFKNIHGVCVESEKLSAIFLPGNGGRLVSLVCRKTGTEFLCQDPNPIYLPQSADGVYVNGEVSGVDDLFPTIDPCKTEFSREEYPCHGEVLRHPHQFRIVDDRLIEEFTSTLFGYQFTKTAFSTGDGAIGITYEIANQTDRDFPCLFGLHCMFAAEKGGRAVLFETVKNGIIMFDEDGEFGKRGETVPICNEMLQNTGYDPQNNAYKYYLCGEKSIGKCGYQYTNGTTVTMEYDSKIMPYLGIWVNNGRFKGQYNMALEPCTIPFDSPQNAKEAGKSFIIPAKSKLAFTVVLDVQ